MNLRRASFIAAVVYLPIAAGPAGAQSPPAAQSLQQAPPCVKEFIRLRDDTAKKADAIRVASDHKASAKDACHLFTVFSTAEAKLLKYATENSTWCGIPAQIVDQIKKGHDKTKTMRFNVCKAAEAPPPPPAPTLSAALGGPIPDASNIKTGRGGTFDTLTGAPLGSR